MSENRQASTLTQLPGRLQAWALHTFRVEDTMLALNLALSTKHTTTELARFEAPDEWVFALAFSFGVDIGIAFSSWVACNTTLKPVVRIIAATWLTGLLAFNYYLNLCHYIHAGAGMAAWGIAAVFPSSMAACGAIKAFRYEGESGVRAVIAAVKATATKAPAMVKTTVVPASTPQQQPVMTSTPQPVALPVSLDYCILQVIEGKMSGKEAATFTGKSEATISRAVKAARSATQPPNVGVI